MEAKLVQMQIAMWFDDQKLDYDMESMVKIHDYRVAMLEEKKQVFQRKWDIVTQDNVYLIQRMMDAAELKDTMDAFPIKNPKSLYTMFDRTVMYSMEGKLNRVQDESFSVLDHVDANVNPREEFHCQLALWLYVALDMAYAKFSQDENCVQKMDQLASSFGHHMTVPEHVQRAILCFWYIDNLSVFNEEFRQQALQRTFNILAKGNLSDKLSVDDRYAIIQNIQYVGQEQKHAAKIADALELPHTSLWPEHFNLIATSMYLDCGSWEIALQIQREVVSAENANDQTLQTKLLQMMFIWFERTSNVPNVMDLQLSSFEESMLIQFLLRPRDNHLASVGSIKAANFLIAYLLQQYKLEEAMEYDKAHRLALRSCGASHVLDGEEFKIRNAILQAHVRILYPGRKDTLERKLNGTMSTSMEVSDNTENSTFSMDGESKNPFLVAYRLSMENQNHSLSVVETVSHVSPPFRLSPPTKATTITNADPVLPPTSDKPIHLQIEKLRGASFSSPPSSYAASPIPSTKSKYSRSSRYKDTDSIASPMHHGDVQSPSIQLSKRLQMSPASSIASEVDHSTPVSKTPISTIESKSKFKHLTQRTHPSFIRTSSLPLLGARYRALQTPPAKRLPKSKPDSSFHNQEHNGSTLVILIILIQCYIALALRDDNTNDPMSGKPPTSPAASSTKKHQPYQFASVSTPPKTRSRSSKFETPGMCNLWYIFSPQYVLR